MSERRIPTKMVSGKMKMGVDSFSEITPERLQLRPVQTADSFSPTGTNKITFQIPTFANAFLDTGKSFVSFDLGYVSATAQNASNTLMPCLNAPVFSRLVCRSSNGLVLDDVSSYNVLSQINAAIKPVEEAVNPAECRYANSYIQGSPLPATAFAEKLRYDTDASSFGTTYVHRFNTGVLSAATESWLPLFMMGSTHALEFDLYLNPNLNSVMKRNGTVATPTYVVRNPVYNMELRRIDESLCRKFNEIACSSDEEIVIPFSTMHAYTSVLQKNQNILKVHEAATNLKRIYNVFIKTDDDTTDTAGNAYALRGGSASDRSIVSFNARLGSKWVYNEAVSTEVQMLTHLKNALGMSDKVLKCEDENSNGTPLFKSRAYIAVADFQYTDDKFLNGVSSSTPIEQYVDMGSGYTTNDLMAYSFVEMGYNLTIKGGQVRFVEQKPGSHQVY